MTPRPSSHKRIMLIEDNPSDVYLLRRSLDEHGISCDLEVVRDGEEALKHFERLQTDVALLPDLVVLDLNLPRHDGIEVLESCRRIAACASVPVMILTSSESPTERRRAEELGVSDYVRKPIMLDEFMAVGGRIKSIFEGRSASPSA